ncbi:MAG: hypothetical protein K9M57_00655 [Phycisphaerae bacterium]|nr:hypothetical protein [Phycisphaerae bacterium]
MRIFQTLLTIFLFTAFCPMSVPAATAKSVSQPVVDAEGLGFEEIIFVKRKPYSSDHYYTDINNGTSADRFIPGNGIFIYNLRTQRERSVITAAQMPGGKGFIGKISLSFDAKKVVFDFRETAGSGFRIWEVHVDGTGLRPITSVPADEVEKANRWYKGWHTDDIHPAYLPDGNIIFSSTRCEHTVLCGGPSALVVPTLHRVEADGKNIEQISRGLLSEFCPLVLDDGRVMYHRWEYIDKGARVAKTIWSMNPDGSGVQEIYGLSDDTTTVYMYPQPLPGGGNKFVCVGTCHYPQGGCLGAIMLVDPDRGERRRGPDPDEAGYSKFDTQYAVTNLTPSVFVERRTEPGWHFLKEEGRYVHDTNGTSGHLYTHPFPVSQEQFLVSYKVKPSDHYKNVANAYSLYLIDTHGNHTPILTDPLLSCWHPTPLVARTTPPAINSYQHPDYAASNEAVCIVTNIYEGMKQVEQGEIKWLRVNEALPRYWSTGRQWRPNASSSSWKGALWPRVQWGLVPVEKDGSAHFKVPAGRSLFFQALDANFKEVQRERTSVNYKAGEIRSCVGCHGKTSNSPGTVTPIGGTPIAVKRAPSEFMAQPCDLRENGGTGTPQQVLHYPSDIQPIFDAKCIDCHGKDKPKGGLTLTGDITAFYSTSYEQLSQRELAGPLISEFTSYRKGDQGNYNGAELPAKSLGSQKSTLVHMLTNPQDPKNVKDDHSKLLTKNELMRVIRWVDTNYQFYGSYYGRQHQAWQNADPKNPLYNVADFRRKPTFQEAISFSAPEWHR